MRSIPRIMFLSAWAASCSVLPPRAAEGDALTIVAIGQDFQREIRPLLERYCFDCHSGDLTEGDLDLESFGTLADVRRDPQTWQKVDEMLDSQQMPPEDADQLADREGDVLRKWVRRYLTLEAAASAGDPGHVVLRRLSNSEYTYTLRDLTGVDSLNPAEEFPIDGAAGEGFTNTGEALVMSPALLSKYLDAAKRVAGHAVLTPAGIRFSQHSTRNDWAHELIASIQDFYRQFSATGGAHGNGGTAVDLQGIKFQTNQGGLLPIEKYLQATLVERDALKSGKSTTAEVAGNWDLNANYLNRLWKTLISDSPPGGSHLLDLLREHWCVATADDVPALAAQIVAWQQAVWKFNPVGHIGREGGPTSWMEASDPLMTRQEFRLKIPQASRGEQISLTLRASTAGDGNKHDFVVWERPRLVAAGRPELLLRDVRKAYHLLRTGQRQIIADTAKSLQVAAEVRGASRDDVDIEALALRHGVDAVSLRAWFELLGIGDGDPHLNHFTAKIDKFAGYDVVKGWGTAAPPFFVANPTDQTVRVPGELEPHSVAVHPTASQAVVVGWRSPVKASLRIEATIRDAHPTCGTRVNWYLELRRGASSRLLAEGLAQGLAQGAGDEDKSASLDSVQVQPGDFVTLHIGPRDQDDSCNLTAIDLVMTSEAAPDQSWHLTEEVSPDILAANPRADRFEHEGVWHFFTERIESVGARVTIPADSLLWKWNRAADRPRQQELAEAMQRHLELGAADLPDDSPDAALIRGLTAHLGWLVSSTAYRSNAVQAHEAQTDDGATANRLDDRWGLDLAQFGRHPAGDAAGPLAPNIEAPNIEAPDDEARGDATTVEESSLCVQAPAVLEIKLPAELASGAEFVTTGTLHTATGRTGSVQLRAVVAGGAEGDESSPTDADDDALFSDNKIVVAEVGATRDRYEKAIAEFRDLFPIALCYERIVPVDEVVTMTLYHREDGQLQRLMLDSDQTAELNRMWDELVFVSHEPLKLVTAYEQSWDFFNEGTPEQKASLKVLEKSIRARADRFRQQLVDAEPNHVAALLTLAGRAWRRPLTGEEEHSLRDLYQSLRDSEIPHDEAIRVTLARVLTSPSFLYRLEQPAPGDESAPISSRELGARLSYFLWSSMPDGELRQLAEAGQLTSDDILVAQTRRLLDHDRIHRLAIHFACQWLHIRDFDQNDEKNEQLYPEFENLRGAMYEESVRFFADMFRNDRSILELLASDHTFLNEPLAKHYGVDGVLGAHWRRVAGVGSQGRGGVLAMATVLAKQSGASRTSPILRGNWISETLLGERLPNPPDNVPQLPETVPSGLSARELIERHSSAPECAKCHARIDPYGFALEQYDAIGRLRSEVVDTKTTLPGGKKIEGMDGLRDYLLTDRRDDIVRQFCRKLLGYALGRAVQLSDQPIIDLMMSELAKKDYHFSAAVETIVLSEPFRKVRGRLWPVD